MPESESSSIPLAEILRAANGLVEARLIEDYALGGALAAIYYVEPFTTYDADIDHLMARGFPVQLLAAHGLTEEAVREARPVEFEGVPAKVFRAEHIVAIAASVGRHKDRARIEQILQQTDIDKTLLEKILQRHKLKLPEL